MTLYVNAWARIIAGSAGNAPAVSVLPIQERRNRSGPEKFWPYREPRPRQSPCHASAGGAVDSHHDSRPAASLGFHADVGIREFRGVCLPPPTTGNGERGEQDDGSPAPSPATAYRRRPGPSQLRDLGLGNQ